MTDLSMIDPGTPPPVISGLTTGPILGDLAAQAAPPSVDFGAFEGQDWFPAIKQTFRFSANQDALFGTYNGQGDMITAPQPRLDADDANAKYAVDDPQSPLKFTAPVPDSVAQSMHDAKVAELDRRAIAEMSPQTFWAKAGRLGAGFVAGALDPLNVAAAFIPVVGEARYAAMLEGAGGALGRFGVRAAVGAAQGVAGQIPLSAMRYGMSQAEQADYTATEALLDVAYGGLLGGGLHAAGGAIGDALTGTFRASPEAAMADADLSTREGALRTSLAQVMTDRPVEVQPVFDAALAKAETQPLAASETMPPDTVTTPGQPLTVEYGTDDGGRILGTPRAQREPQTLLQFIAANGGIRDEGGELTAMDLHQPQTGFQPGFGPVVRARGLHPDAMRELAESGGWLTPDKIDETTTMGDLYEAIENEIKSGRDYHQPVEHVADPDYEAHLRHLEQLAEHDAPELSEEGMLDQFVELAARERPEDIGSHGRHDEFDIPWDDVSGPGPDNAEAGGGAPHLGRGETVAPAEGGGRENAGGGPAGLTDAPDRFQNAVKAAAGEPSPELQAIFKAADDAQTAKSKSVPATAERRSATDRPGADATPPQIRTQTEDLQALADHLRQVGDLPKDSETELTAADAGLTRAQAIGKGLASAAQCLIAEGI